MKPSSIVSYLDQYVIGQDDAKKTVAVAVYSHYRKIEKSRRDNIAIVKSNVLLIGPSGTGKTLMCETLSHGLAVPFVTAEATSLAQTRYVNEEIEAILQRLVDKANGDIDRAQSGIVFIDEIDKLKSSAGKLPSVSGESVQHALLKIMEGAPVKIGTGRYVDTTHILFICGGAFVGIDDIMSQTHNFGFIATTKDESQKIHDRERDSLVRIMIEPRNSIYEQFRDIFANEGVDLVVEPRVFEQIAELAIEYKTGARSLRGIFEELITPVLYAIPDDPGIGKVVIASLFSDPTYLRKAT